MYRPRRFRSTHLLLAVLALCLVACGGGENEGQGEQGGAAVNLRVMSFNIEWGGTHISFDKVIEAIRLADADIVGIQEAEGNLQRLAGELGWNYHLRSYTISRFPILDPPGAEGKFVYVELEPGRVIAIANVHLPSDSPGADMLRDGADPMEVLEVERNVRLSKMQPYLAALAPLIESDMPLFVTGDFNAPSHADWTPAAVGTRPFLSDALDWPVSLAMEKAGFSDSWREVYPDPVASPGLTWWAARPPLELYAPGENDPQDRIDYVWYTGAATVQSSELVGEAGGPEVSFSVEPWPTDHRGVVSQFSVLPVAMPAFVDTGRRLYHLGEEVDVRFHGPGTDLLTVSVSNMAVRSQVLAENITNGSGHTSFPAELFEAGHYRVAIADEDGFVLMENDFWVLDPGALPQVAVDGGSFRVGEALGVKWRNAPGNRNDYVAVYSADTPAGYGNELAWMYVDALPEGQLTIESAVVEGTWPLPPGSYVIRLMEDDGYDQLAESPEFVIR